MPQEPTCPIAKIVKALFLKLTPALRVRGRANVQFLMAQVGRELD